MKQLYTSIFSLLLLTGGIAQTPPAPATQQEKPAAQKSASDAPKQQPLTATEQQELDRLIKEDQEIKTAEAIITQTKQRIQAEFGKLVAEASLSRNCKGTINVQEKTFVCLPKKDEK